MVDSTRMYPVRYEDLVPGAKFEVRGPMRVDKYTCTSVPYKDDAGLYVVSCAGREPLFIRDVGVLIPNEDPPNYTTNEHAFMLHSPPVEIPNTTLLRGRKAVAKDLKPGAIIVVYNSKMEKFEPPYICKEHSDMRGLLYVRCEGGRDLFLNDVNIANPRSPLKAYTTRQAYLAYEIPKNPCKDVLLGKTIRCDSPSIHELWRAPNFFDYASVENRVVAKMSKRINPNTPISKTDPKRVSKTMTNALNMSDLITLAQGVSEDAVPNFLAAPGAVQKVLKRKLQEAVDAAAETTADSIMSIIADAERDKEYRAKRVTFLKKWIQEHKEKGAARDRAYAYGMETNNWLPLVKLVCEQNEDLISEEERALGQIPEGWEAANV